MFGLEDIKAIRKKLDLTQHELAIRSGVSQSLIAKIEARTIDPTFSNAKKIMQCLSSINEKEELNARQLMQKKIISVDADERLKKVISKMKKHSISQMPVFENNKVVGVVSESAILNAIIKGKLDQTVADVMEDKSPTVPKSAPLSMISTLLRFYQLIIVAEKGKPLGVITKSDVIEKAYK